MNDIMLALATLVDSRAQLAIGAVRFVEVSSTLVLPAINPDATKTNCPARILGAARAGWLETVIVIELVAVAPPLSIATAVKV